jgi:hypothetical protein
VFETNYLAGGSLTRLPAGTLVQEDFEHQFVDTVTGDYTVRDGMILDRAASDGSGIGVRFPALIKAVDGVEEGRPAGSVPVGAPTAALQVSCTYLVCDFADTSSPGGGAIRSRAWSFCDGDSHRRLERSCREDGHDGYGRQWQGRSEIGNPELRPVHGDTERDGRRSAEQSLRRRCQSRRGR